MKISERTKKRRTDDKDIETDGESADECNMQCVWN